MKPNFQKNKLVTGKTPLFVTVPFSTTHSICLLYYLTSILFNM